MIDPPHLGPLLLAGGLLDRLGAHSFPASNRRMMKGSM
jgi:hypothetical protein